MTVEEMKQVDIRTVKAEELADITKISLEDCRTKEEKIKSFLEQVGNPYCYRVGDIIVKTRYSEDGVSFHERFEQLIASI